jgi:hypothetical protein
MGRIPKAIREKASETKMDVTSSNNNHPTSTSSSSVSPTIKSSGSKLKQKKKKKESSNSSMSSSSNTNAFNSSTSSNLTRSSISSSTSDDSIGDYLENEDREEDEDEAEEEEESVDNTDDDENFLCDNEEEEEEKTDNKCKTNKKSLIPVENKLSRKHKITKDSSNKIEIKQEKLEIPLNTQTTSVDDNNNNDKMIIDEEIKGGTSQAQTKEPDQEKIHDNNSQVDSLENTTTPNEVQIICTTNRTTSISKHQDWFARFMNIINSDNYVDKSQFYLSTPKSIMESPSSDTPNSFMSSLFNHNINNTNHFSTQLLTNLLKHHKPLCKSLIQPNTYYSDLFMNLQPCDPSYLLISSLLNDKIYQLYNECYKKVHEAFEKAQYLIKHNIKTFEGSECTTKEIWNYLVDSIPNFVKLVIL